MQLHERTCKATGISALDESATEVLASELQQEWNLDIAQHTLSRDFGFANFHQTMAFVNAVAWIAHQQDHHPDMQVGYKHCHVHYSTHSVNGLSENDFICAAKIDHLLEQ